MISSFELQGEIADFNSKANQLEDNTKEHIKTADQCDLDIRWKETQIWNDE